MSIQYINLNTGAPVQDGTIRSITDNGIITNTRNSWKLIPHDQLQQESANTGAWKKEPVTEHRQVSDNPFLFNSENPDSLYTENIEYRFGFTDLVFSTQQAAAASALVTQEIDVAGTEYIEVFCSVINQDAGSVEIYIVDNIDEIPILPNQDRTVIKERLFYNMDTRFIVDASQPVTLYQDHKIIQQSYASLTPQQLQSNLYTLSYTAAGEPFRYKPAANKIRLKLICRQYKEAPLIMVQNLFIKKYGGTATWNSNR